MQEYYCKVNEAPGNQEGGTMREQIAEFIFDVVVEVGDLTRQELLDDYGIDIGEYPLWAKLLPNTKEKCYKRADQIFALLEPQILTPAEARTLLECFEYDSLSRYSKVNRQAPLYLKLKKIVEGTSDI